MKKKWKKWKGGEKELEFDLFGFVCVCVSFLFYVYQCVSVLFYIYKRVLWLETRETDPGNDDDREPMTWLVVM